MYKLEHESTRQRLTRLRVAAAARHGLAPAGCHVGHLLLGAFLEDPAFLHQVDAGTDESQTNIEVGTQSMRLASALRNYGLVPGDHVVLIGDNTVRLALPFYACHYNGLALCPTDISIVQKDIVLLFDDVKPKFVFCQKSKVDEINFAISRNKLKCGILTLDEDNEIDNFVEQHHGTEKGFSPAVFDLDKVVAWLILTSGSTGLPKVVMVTYERAMSAIHITCASQPFRLLRTATTSSIQWISTILTFAISPLMMTTRVQTSKQVTTQHLRHIIDTYKPNRMLFGPHLLRDFLQQEGASCDLRCLQVVNITGSAFQHTLLERMQAKVGGFVFNIYGLTETLMSLFQYIPGATPAGSVGVPKVDELQYKLVDEQGRDVVIPNQVGELWVRGSSFFNGYLNKPEETTQTLTADGWLKTGDLFCRDENYFYYFKERKRLLIKYKLRYVAPLEIEEVILRHDGVAQVCVVGVPHPACCELTVAVVARRRGAVVEPEDIFSIVNAELPELKRLHGGLVFVDALPLTPTGKTNRAQAKEWAQRADRILPRNTLLN